MVSMVAGDAHLLMDVGPFGPWTGGHSHADTLSITLRHGMEELLIDPGTFTYVGDATDRNYFRRTGAHNTVQIDHFDQATPVGAFSWADHPLVASPSFKSSEEEDYVEGECVYRGFRHRRRLLFRKKEGWILVCDLIDGPADGEHDLRQIWQTGKKFKLLQPGVFQMGKTAMLFLPGNTEFSNNAWRSPTLGSKERIPVARQIRRSSLPVVMPAAISLTGETNIGFHIKGETTEFTTNDSSYYL